MKFPPPNATRLEVMRFLRERKAEQFEPKHEAPPGDKGPSIVCNACGVVRVPWNKLLCASCKKATCG